MKHYTLMICFLLIAGLLITSCTNGNKELSMGVTEAVQQQTTEKMIQRFGEEHADRIQTGVRQIAERWRSDDGSAEEFESFCLENFYHEQDDLDMVFERFQTNLEALFGNLHRINRQFMWHLHVDTGPVIPLDHMFGEYDIYAHVTEDLFRSGIAFTALLNYPIYTLEEKTRKGNEWSRRTWAEARLADGFVNRIPADVNQRRSEIRTRADDYIANYNIYMNNLLDDEGNRLFPEDLRLISHWGLRDELKAQYANPDLSGLERQRMIYQVMQRIIGQEIPAVMVNNDEADWNPYTNEVWQRGTQERAEPDPEPNTRYEHFWRVFEGEKAVDPYTPDTPSLIDRRFNRQREILEDEVEAMLVEVLTASVLNDIARLIERRLGRELEPFDIWYDGFKARGQYPESRLDEIVRARFPDVEAFENQLPQILRRLGFSPDRAAYLSDRITVDPSRGAGHAWGARMRGDRAHLRTRVHADGMDYKGFNIAIHELGHNVEQVFTLEGVDYYTMNGVPNTAFTEAFAFVFQYRDLDILGLTTADPHADALRALNDMWMTYEIAGVSLVDMRVWRWMYENPDAGPQQLRDAVQRIATGVWNEYYAPVYGIEDVSLLCIYSHMISLGMYIPDYAIGHIIAFQIEDYLKGRDLAREMERMCVQGSLTPQIWMQGAVGSPITARPMVDAAQRAVLLID
jgi:hypothetical protein